MKRKWAISHGSFAVAVAWLCSVWALPAAAQSCQLETEPMAFGSYDTTDTVPTRTTGAVRVACDSGLAYQIQLSAGAYSSGSFVPRQMKHEQHSQYLQYNIFTASGETLIWGDGSAGTGVVTGTGVGLGTWNNHGTYGKINPLQSVYSGGYSDAITVQVLW